MAEVNPAYQIEHITDDVRAEVLNVLQDSKGIERDERAINHEVVMLRVAYGAMLRQIYADARPPARPGNRQWTTPRPPPTAEAWRRVSPTPTKRMQAKFTPTAFRRPNATIDQMIFDVREISPTLLKNLGLGEFVMLKKELPPVKEGDAAGNDLEARKLAAREGAIPGLKDIFSDLTPIPTMWGVEGLSKNFRMYMIGKGAAKGKLLITRSENGKYQMGVYDLLGAVRRVDEVRQQYDTETVHLRQIYTLLDSVLDLINVPKAEILNEGDFETRTKQIDAAKKDLAATVEKLKKVRDSDKEKLRDVIEAISDFKDSVGRENFGSTAAQLAPIVRSGKFIGSRAAGMKAKAGALESDQRVLLGAATAHRKPFEDAYNTVKENDIPAEKDLTATDRGRIMAYAKVVEHSLKSLKLEPFASFAQRMQYHIDELRLCITKPNREHTGEGVKPTITEELLRVFLVGKVTLFHREMMKLYAKIALHQDTPPIDEWIKTTEGILTAIDNRPVGKKTYAAEFIPLWNAMKTFIAEQLQPAIEGLNPDARLDENKSDREGIKEVMSTFFDQILIPFMKNPQPRLRTLEDLDEATSSARQRPPTPDETPIS